MVIFTLNGPNPISEDIFAKGAHLMYNRTINFIGVCTMFSVILLAAWVGWAWWVITDK